MVAKICAYFSVCVAFLTCVSVVCGAYKTKVLTILYTKVLGSFTDHSALFTIHKNSHALRLPRQETETPSYFFVLAAPTQSRT